MSTTTTGTGIPIFTGSTSAPPALGPDVVLQKFKLYEEDGKITFTHESNRYYRTGRLRWYAYYTDTRQLWRVYAKNKKKMARVMHWNSIPDYIERYDLDPVWPKHMRMDRDL